MTKHLMGLLLTVPALSVFALTACSHNPNKAEKIETKMEKSSKVTDEEVGVKDGNMVVQKKTLISEELRDLQYEVYSLEDQVYGNQKFGSLGLYGNLRKCKTEIADKINGGDGKMLWTEPMDRVTDKEDDLKLGLDENDKLVGVSEEMLRDRINRFREYKRLLQKRQNEYQEKLEICQTNLKAQKFEINKKQE